MTPEEMLTVVAIMSARVDRVIAQTETVIAHVARIEAERDYAVAVADSLRDHNARLERELGEALRRLVDGPNAPHANR